MTPPLARTIILTDAGTMAWTEALAAYDGTLSAVLISYTLAVDGPASVDPAPVQDFALEDLGLQPNEGGGAAAIQDFALEDMGLQPNEGGSTPVQDFALEALPTQPSEA